MPPAIVYENMDDSAHVQGGLFAGLKFFILQRVPQRSTFVSLVEANGGTVVRLEAQADYIIADHMRQDAPAHSLSYRFLEAAVKQGIIPEDETPFLASSRKSANTLDTTISSSNKSTRTPFTSEDDKLLYAWVTKAQQDSLAVQGNKLYQLLEAYNSRHTYQSWRDRYVKNLSKSAPSGWHDYLEANLDAISAAIRQLPPTTLPRSTPSIRPPPSRPEPSPPRARIHFTEEDDQELESFVARAVRLGALPRGNTVYKELEAINPRHSYQSWKDRWLKRFSHTLSVENDASTPGPSTNPSKPRVPFTEEDDEYLMEWIQRARGRGERLMGVDLYKQLAQANPRHTHHSWRDRYVKYLSVQESTEAEGPSVRRAASPGPPVSRPPVKRSKFRIPPAAQESGTPESVTAPPESVVRSTKKSTVSNTPHDVSSTPAKTAKNHANTSPSRHRTDPSTMSPEPQLLAQDTYWDRPSLQHSTTQTDPVSPLHDDSTFTKKDFDILLKMAIDIQNVCVGRYQESWIAYAEQEPHHTAVEWRSFYERRVLPVALQKSKDQEFRRAQGDQKWIEFWEQQGQPITTLPYLEQVVASKVQCDSENVGNVCEDSTSRAIKNINIQSALSFPDKRKISHVEQVPREEPPAKRQHTESEEGPAANGMTQATQNTNLRTPISVSSQVAPSPSYHSEEAREMQEDEPAEQLYREMEENKDSRHQLTRANLARIQAEHGSSEENRGVDLEKDDEDDDQGNFADYIGSLLPPGLKEKAMETIEARTQRNDDHEEYDDDDDDEAPIVSSQAQEHEIDPALLADDPDLDQEYLNNDTAMQLDIPETQPWEASSAPSQPQRERFNTQAIYDAETQPFDADVPLPPEPFSSSPSPPQATTESQVLSEEELWPWVDSQMVNNHTEEAIIQALRQTSLNPKLAIVVLDARGERVNMAGVWLEHEDEVAEGGDARAMRLLEKKHGVDSVEARIHFLNRWREDEALAAQGELED